MRYSCPPAAHSVGTPRQEGTAIGHEHGHISTRNREVMLVDHGEYNDKLLAGFLLDAVSVALAIPDRIKGGLCCAWRPAR